MPGTRYRKRPVEIHAIQWDGTADGATPIINWILASDATATYLCSNPERCAATAGDVPHSIQIHTLEGVMTATVGDWIIRGVQGEFYPCRDDIFAATYEAADEHPSDRPAQWPTEAAMHAWHREHGLRVLEWQRGTLGADIFYRPTHTQPAEETR